MCSTPFLSSFLNLQSLLDQHMPVLQVNVSIVPVKIKSTECFISLCDLLKQDHFPVLISKQSSEHLLSHHMPYMSHHTCLKLKWKLINSHLYKLSLPAAPPPPPHPHPTPCPPPFSNGQAPEYECWLKDAGLFYVCLDRLSCCTFFPTLLSF